MTPTLTDEQLTEHVAVALRPSFPDAYAEHTGGGIFCVLIPNVHRRGDVAIAGMADVCWSANYYVTQRAMDDGEDPVSILETTVPSDSQNIAAIVTALEAALRRR